MEDISERDVTVGRLKTVWTYLAMFLDDEKVAVWRDRSGEVWETYDEAYECFEDVGLERLIEDLRVADVLRLALKAFAGALEAFDDAHDDVTEESLRSREWADLRAAARAVVSVCSSREEVAQFVRKA